MRRAGRCRAASGRGAWEQLDALTTVGRVWELLPPSPFARQPRLLEQFAHELGLERNDDPLATLRRLMAEMYTASSTARRARASIRRSTRRSRRGAACARTSRTSSSRSCATRRPVPLRQRLSVSPATARCTRRTAPRTPGSRPAAGPGVGRVRSDQQPDRRRPPHPRRDRPRLRGRAADARRLQGIERRAAASWRWRFAWGHRADRPVDDCARGADAHAVGLTRGAIVAPAARPGPTAAATATIDEFEGPAIDLATVRRLNPPPLRCGAPDQGDRAAFR